MNNVESARRSRPTDTRVTAAERAEHDAATLQALVALAPDGAGPDVAGLFAHGRDLCARPDAPSVAFFIGHAGREVTRGIVALLLGPSVKSPTLAATPPTPTDAGQQGGPPTDDDAAGATAAATNAETADDSEAKDAFRDVLAAVLGVGRNDPVVKRWFELHNRFVAASHFHSPAPSLQHLRELFAEFAEFLYGLVGPFYDTQTELDALADLANPIDADVERLAQRLLRRAQRQRFFARANPAWLLPLARAGFFRRPPERRIEVDGSWRVTPWPEGEFLVRVAATNPADVTSILGGVPRTLENPAVWDVVARAAKLLPPEEAARLADLLVHALKTAPPVIYPHTLVDVVARLAEGGQETAFRIAEALLWIAKAPSEPARKEDEGEGEYLARRREESDALLMRFDWLLARVLSYDFSRFVQVAVPALTRLDAAATLKLLTGIVNRVDRTLGRVEARLVAPDEAPRVDGRSRQWSSDLVHGGADHHELLGEIATVVASTALSLADSDGDGAPRALAILEGGRAEILDRVRFLVIAAAGPHVQEALDRAVADPAILSPAYGAAEIAHLLRKQFANASDHARAVFAAALREGPDPESVIATLQFWERPETDEEKSREVARWQVRRLRWFHDQIPPELADLAARLGVASEVPDARQQALDEVGSWSSGVHSRRERSPVAAEDLLALSASEAFELLASWRPTGERTFDEDPPSRAGLGGAVQEAAAASPQMMLAWARHLPSSSLEPYFVHSVLAGLHQAMNEKRPVDLEAILAFVDAAFGAAEEGAGGEEVGWGCTEAVRVIETVGHWENLSADDAAEVMRSLLSLSSETIARLDEEHESESASLERAIRAGWSTLAGRMLEAAFVLASTQAWGAYRNVAVPAEFPPVVGLTQLAERLLSLAAHAGVGARAALGDRLVDVFWLAPSWADAQLPPELDALFATPARKPAFASYLAHSRVYRETFQRLRAWYLRLAGEDVLRQTPVTGKSTLGGLLVNHVIGAITLGACSPGDPDGLVERTFAQATTEDVGHAYWVIFRTWSDADMAVLATKAWLDEAAPRVLQLWEWRLIQLESTDAGTDVGGEADSLLWFLATPHLPANEAIALGRRTIQLLETNSRTAGSVWERLAELSKVDAAGSFDLAERLVLRFLDSDFIYLPFDDVAPVFRAALRGGGALRDRAKRLINLLGERGHGEFEPLYREAGHTEMGDHG